MSRTDPKVLIRSENVSGKSKTHFLKPGIMIGLPYSPGFESNKLAV